MKRAIIIHGHFYQPPRENPWLGVILKQPSASPYHDWNERINAECYAPNSVSRILNERGRIIRLVNNYEKISFNFGPTLMDWLRAHSPSVYSRILMADRKSMVEKDGHGNAIAQCYNHIIMPLANRQDKITQVRWGIRDFQFHFGRKPEGMWLPETAVDLETLDILAQEGIRFTILSPHQAERIKPIKGKRWKRVEPDGPDPSRPYLQRLPTGREIVIFFYNGHLSHQIAFGSLLKSGEGLASKLLQHPVSSIGLPLLSIATDGETFGHHHKFAEMALSYAIKVLEGSDDVWLTNFGAYLDRVKPDFEVMIKENTSWSCAHGIERWRSDCGCTIPTKQGWSQAWRTPLREALDLLRYHFIRCFQQQGSELFKDPWEARNDFIDVLLDKGRLGNFLKKHLLKAQNSSDVKRALKLLQMQRNAMLMYTSCGWFFDEPSRPETLQILSYSLRAITLYEELCGDDLLSDFLDILSEGKSNIEKMGTLADLFKDRVMAERIGNKEAALIGAFYFGLHPDKDEYRKGSLKIKKEHLSEESQPDTYRMSLLMEIGEEEEKQRVELLVFEPAGLKTRVRFLDKLKGIDETTTNQLFTLKDLLYEEREQYLQEISRRKMKDILSLLKGSYRELDELLDHYRAHSLEPPTNLKPILDIALKAELMDILLGGNPDELTELLIRLKRLPLTLRAEEYEYPIRRFLERSLRRLSENPVFEKTRALAKCLEELKNIGFSINLWTVQNIYYEMLINRWRGKPLPDMIKRLGEALYFDVETIKGQIDE